MAWPKNYEVRLDEDGKHIWFTHDCKNGRETTWLPSTWKVVGKEVRPSIVCNECGFHEMVQITEERP